MHKCIFNLCILKQIHNLLSILFESAYLFQNFENQKIEGKSNT